MEKHYRIGNASETKNAKAMEEKYRIVNVLEAKVANAMAKVEEQVNQLYNEGWIAHGTLGVIKEKADYCGDSYVAYQAMIKEPKDDTCIICGATHTHFLSYEGKIICAKCARGIKNMI